MRFTLDSIKQVFLLLVSLPFAVAAQAPVENYPQDPASVEQPGVPKGEVLKFTLQNSKIFPGTLHDYSVYIPAQYDPAKSTCLYVNQDAIQFNAPVVFDNLIAAKEMPVTIGVFVSPGRVVANNPQSALDRYNRSFEYDGLGDAYVRFLLEELLPDMEKQKTSDGRAIRFSRNGNDHAIGGSSSGAIAAFTAAWERPDAFQRVFSSVGTYVGLRGGDRYAALIRKVEPKPIRIFLQDGSHDNNAYGGDWWFANQMMERSLTWAGYEVRHEWGEGGHNQKHSTSLFPAAMRWLWKDYPSPVKAGVSPNAMMKDILIPGESWQAVEGRPRIFSSSSITGHNGNTYSISLGKIYLTKKGNSTKTLLEQDLKVPGGISFTPDQTQLYITESGSHWVYLYSIQKDGSLTNTQRYNWLYTPDENDRSGAGGIKCDTAGRVYIATKMGVQICDQAGRVNVILPLPSGEASELWFGGENSDLLFVISGDRVYRRKLKTSGIKPQEAPVKPMKPKL